MVQQVKVLATQLWRPEFNPWYPPWKGRLKLTRLSSDLHMCTHIMHTDMHVRIHTLIINIFKLLSQGFSRETENILHTDPQSSMATGKTKPRGRAGQD